MKEETTTRISRTTSKHRKRTSVFPFRTIPDHLCVLIEMHLDGRQAPAILRDLTRLLGPISVEGGCEHCRIWMDYEDPRNILMGIGWRSEADLAQFLKSEKFLALLAIADTAAYPPRLYVSDRRQISLQAAATRPAQNHVLQSRNVS